MRKTVVQGSSYFFGKLGFRGLKAAAEGEWYVISIECDRGAPGRTTFNGPHAKFQVKTGEIVNVGLLILEPESDGIFTRTGKLRRSVKPLSPQVLEFLRKAFPKTMQKVVSRPMAVVGPENVKTQRPGW